MTFKINIYLTTSKLAAYLILIVGSVYSFINADGYVMLGTFSATSAVLMMKTYQTKRNYQKPQIEPEPEPEIKEPENY